MNIRHSRKFDICYMKIALEIAKLSYCKRLQVGCIIVKNNSIIAEGYNGTPSGFKNCCEEEKQETFIDHENGNFYHHPVKTRTIYVTHPQVLHAETNAIAKLAKSTNSSEGATMYTTVSPCIECAKLIIQCGIVKVVYLEQYRDEAGVELLGVAGIQIEHFKFDDI